MEYETIRFEVTDHVATVTLNRPAQMNAFVASMGDELGDAMVRCDEDDDVRAVVVTGAGRAFCAGADLNAGGSTFAPEVDSQTGATGGDARRALEPWQIRKPVIAAINGHAIGVGITYALQCDIRFVAHDAKIAFAFVRRGVIPELASHVLLPRVVGFSRAADLLLSGRTILGTEAAELGLASKALPTEDVLPHARAYAHDLARNTAPVSVAIAKRLMWEGVASTVPEMHRREDSLFGLVGRQPDAVEGVMSFVEKREPAWRLSPTADYPDWPTE